MHTCPDVILDDRKHTCKSVCRKEKNETNPARANVSEPGEPWQLVLIIFYP